MTKPSRTCPGPNRREVLRFGSVGLGSAALGPLRGHKARAADHATSDPAVIFVWLPGGPPAGATARAL